MNTGLHLSSSTLGGTNESGPGGAPTPLLQDLTPLGGAMDQLTQSKTTVRKAAGKWRVDCPCGFTWRSREHRLALRLAIWHEHRKAVA